MPPKKTYRKKKVNNEEIEHLGCATINGSKISSSALENNANNTTNGLVNKKIKSKQLLPMNESAEKENIPTEEEYGNFVSSKCNKNETVENDLMFLQDMLNLTGDNSHEVQSCRGQKRPFEDCIDLIEKENDLSSSIGSSDDVINKLKKRCIDLENQIMKSEQTLMPPPQHQDFIQFIIETAKTLQNHPSFTNHDSDKSLINIMETLGMTNDELTRCKKKTATATVRSIIRHLYPNPKPDFGYAQLDPLIIQKAIEYTKFSNPFDKVTVTELRRAISNHFSALAYHRKNQINEYFGPVL